MAWPRPGGADDLGLKHALPGRLLPLLVGAMVFLAALAGGACIAAGGLARQWRAAGDATTVQVPDPAAPASGQTRAALAAGLLGPQARRLGDAEVAGLLRPWLGEDALHLGVMLPAVFTLPAALPAGQQAGLLRAVPGATVGGTTIWQVRLQALAASLRACAALALVVVACVAAALVAVATRAGLTAGRAAIEIVHGLGATDGLIAGRFAARIATLALAGGLAGAVLAVPVLLGLARVTAPFQSAMEHPAARLPGALWALVAALPALACLIGWATSHLTVRAWLGKLA